MKRQIMIMAFAFALVLGTGMVAAAPDSGTVTTGTSGAYSAAGPGSYASTGGDVTEINVSSTQSTQKWQGFWGNVSGNLRLGDGTDVFYDWTNVAFSAVFASLDNTPTWGAITNITSVTTPSLANKDTEFGFTTTDDDSIANTFTGNTCAAGTVIASAAGVTPQGAGAWETCIAEDSGSALTDTIFGTDVASGVGYNSETIEYQLMVPVQGAGNTYFFYLEI